MFSGREGSERFPPLDSSPHVTHVPIIVFATFSRWRKGFAISTFVHFTWTIAIHFISQSRTNWRRWYFRKWEYWFHLCFPRLLLPVCRDGSVNLSFRELCSVGNIQPIGRVVHLMDGWRWIAASRRGAGELPIGMRGRWKLKFAPMRSESNAIDSSH